LVESFGKVLLGPRGSDQQDLAAAKLDSGKFRDSVEKFGSDRESLLGRVLETLVREEARDVQEYSSTGDPGTPGGLNTEPSGCCGVRRRGKSAIKAVLGMSDVSEGIDLRRALQIEIVEPVVSVEFIVRKDMMLSAGSRSGRIRMKRIDRIVEPDSSSGANERCCVRDSFRREEVECPEFVVATKNIPARPGRISCCELGVCRQRETPCDLVIL
jgi:hypothetical protein